MVQSCREPTSNIFWPAAAGTYPSAVAGNQSYGYMLLLMFCHTAQTARCAVDDIL